MKVILSCTTTFERRHIFYYGIQSLLSQSIEPDLFLANISKKSFSESGRIPQWLNKNNININLVEDLGPYTKLLPALKYAEDDDLIITADDDILYQSNWLRELVELSREAPESIICARARKMKKNFFGEWQNYNNWHLVKNKKKAMNLLPTGVGGVGYRTKLLDLDFLTDTAFLKLAPTTDDLWFRMASLREKN